MRIAFSVAAQFAISSEFATVIHQPAAHLGSTISGRPLILIAVGPSRRNPFAQLASHISTSTLISRGEVVARSFDFTPVATPVDLRRNAAVLRLICTGMSR
ncbi:MAG: hypothetical protein ACF8PN_12390 [Phycisphaerales bacterium]